MIHDTFKLYYRGLPIASCDISRSAGELIETVAALHNHKEFELLYIKSGQVRITINNISYPVSAGELILINSYAPHSIEVENRLSFSADCLSFDLSLLGEEEIIRRLEQGECDVLPLIRTDHPQHAALLECFQQAMSVCAGYADYRGILLHGSLQMFFGILWKYQLLVSKSVVDAGNNRFCREVFAFIQSYYADDITSNHAANKLGYTQSYFCRLFKQQFGESFRDYLTMYRISKAKQLLNEGNCSVTQTAEQVGFHNMSYFTRVFQQQTGCLPSHYLRSPHGGAQTSSAG